MKRDPTPDEIAQRSAEVRSRWTAREEQKRRVWVRTRYTVPVIALLDLAGDLSTLLAERSMTDSL